MKMLARLAASTCLVLAGSAVMSTASNAQAMDSLTTTFNSNNGQNGAIFDIEVLANAGLTVTSFDINLDPGDHQIALYTRNDSSIGNQNSAAGWTLREIVAVTSNGNNVPTNVDYADFAVAGNGAVTGIYLVSTAGNNFNYTNGTGVGNTAA